MIKTAIGSEEQPEKPRPTQRREPTREDCEYAAKSFEIAENLMHEGKIDDALLVLADAQQKLGMFS